MTHEQFITELASLRDLMEAMKDDDCNMWRAIYRGNDPNTEKRCAAFVSEPRR